MKEFHRLLLRLSLPGLLVSLLLLPLLRPGTAEFVVDVASVGLFGMTALLCAWSLRS